MQRKHSNTARYLSIFKRAKKDLLCAGALSIFVSSNMFASAWASPSDALVVGMDNAPKSRDPRLIGADANAQYMEELRFLPLVSFNENGGVKLIAAETITPKGTNTFLVTLRKGLKFASGKELKADDVIATYNSILKGSSELPPSPRKGAFESVESILKIDNYSLEFKLKQPDAAFVVNLVVGILPAEGAHAKAEDTVGKGYESGPYVLKDATAQEWVLEKNPAYSGIPYGRGTAKVKEVRIKYIADNTTRFAALVKGDLDLVQNGIDADKVIEVQKKYANKFTVATGTSTSTTSFVFNVKSAPFNNKTVRKAIALAINRDEIIQFILQGFAEKANSMFPKNLPYHENIPEIKHSISAAKDLLNQAGFKDPDGDGPGSRFSFTIKVPTNKERISVAKAIASQLKKVGIEARVESLEFGTFNKQLADGLAQAWIAPWTGYKDPDHLRYCFHTSQIPPVGGNRGRYSEAKVDALLSKGQQELNMEKRLPYYAEAQRLLSDDIPYAYLWYKLNNVITAKGVSGYKLFSDGRYISLTEVTKVGAK